MDESSSRVRFRDPDVLSRIHGLGSFAMELGNTPLIQVPGPPRGAAIFAKCEWHNPTGSIKDRTAYAMVYALLASRDDAAVRQLKILEYSGGNLGLSLGKLCHGLRLPLRLVLGSTSPPSLLSQLAAWGTEVRLMDLRDGFYTLINEAVALSADPGWTFLYQHTNEANLLMHEHGTGAEILQQLSRRSIEAWVASIGTGGTLIGVFKALRARFPHVLAHAVTPAEMPYGTDASPSALPKIAGSGGFGLGRKQPFVSRQEADVHQHHYISYPDALSAMREFHKQMGIYIGSSAAANWIVAQEVARGLSEDDTVVTVFPCSGTPEERARAFG